MIRIPMNLSGCHKRSAKGSTLPLKIPGVFLGRSPPQIDKFPVLRRPIAADGSAGPYVGSYRVLSEDERQIEQ